MVAAARGRRVRMRGAMFANLRTSGTWVTFDNLRERKRRRSRGIAWRDGQSEVVVDVRDREK